MSLTSFALAVIFIIRTIKLAYWNSTDVEMIT